MKKRRSLVIALLLVATLAIGIGYAAYSADLTLTGTAELAKDDSLFVVEFSAPTIEEHDSSDVALPEISGNAPTATLDTATSITFKAYNLASAGDHVLVTTTITNNSDAPDLHAKLTEVIMSDLTISGAGASSADVSFEFELTYNDGETTHTITHNSTEADWEKVVLAPGESANLEVRIVLVDTLMDAITINNATIAFGFEGEIAE